VRHGSIRQFCLSEAFFDEALFQRGLNGWPFIFNDAEIDRVSKPPVRHDEVIAMGAFAFCAEAFNCAL